MNDVAILLGANESLVAVLSGAITTTNPTWSLIWNGDGGPANPVGTLDGTTEVTLLTGVSTPRFVKSVQIYNADSANITVTISKKIGNTLYPIDKATKSAGTNHFYSAAPSGPQGEEGAAGVVDATNVDVGASGTAGSLDIFPTTASKGKIAITATNNTNNDTISITNAAMGQATALTIPDPGDASASFVLTVGARSLTGNLTLASGADLIFSGTTGQSEITLPDNLADALSIRVQDGGADFFVFATTIGGLKVTLAQNLEILDGKSLVFTGTTGQSEIALPDDLADALSVRIKNGGGDFFVFVTTISGPKVTLAQDFEILAKNIILDTTTGTKIGTGVTQKLGFWNATPVVQPSSANQAVAVAASGGDSPTEAEFNAVVTLVNQLRADLVTLGLIKGSA